MCLLNCPFYTHGLKLTSWTHYLVHICLSLLSVAITKYHILDNLERIRAYLFTALEVGNSKSMARAFGEGLLAASQHVRREQVCKLQSSSSYKATNAILRAPP